MKDNQSSWANSDLLWKYSKWKWCSHRWLQCAECTLTPPDADFWTGTRISDAHRSWFFTDRWFVSEVAGRCMLAWQNPPPFSFHPEGEEELCGGQAGSGSSLLLLTSVSWTCRGITAWTSREEWGHSVLCRCNVCICCYIPGGRTHHDRQFALQQSFSRLVLDFMLSLFMLWMLFCWGKKSSVLPRWFCSPRV